jgi:hypothetical protein
MTMEQTNTELPMMSGLNQMGFFLLFFFPPGFLVPFFLAFLGLDSTGVAGWDGVDGTTTLVEGDSAVETGPADSGPADSGPADTGPVDTELAGTELDNNGLAERIAFVSKGATELSVPADSTVLTLAFAASGTAGDALVGISLVGNATLGDALAGSACFVGSACFTSAGCFVGAGCFTGAICFVGGAEAISVLAGSSFGGLSVANFGATTCLSLMAGTRDAGSE